MVVKAAEKWIFHLSIWAFTTGNCVLSTKWEIDEVLAKDGL